MTQRERDFRELLLQDREAALRIYFGLAVDEWLQESREEIARILTFWASRDDGGEPRIVIGDELLVEIYLAKADPDT
jgi:hypothetical protein